MFKDSSSNDYARVEQAIAYLRLHRCEQPSLTQLAQQVGLSEAHFQRLFTRWAGISPKRFLQFLNLQYAKQRMAQAQDLLGVSLDTGLSGSGRLHDLFVTLEGLTPAQFRTQADGLMLRFGRANSPFGKVLLAFSERGLCHLSFVSDDQDDRAQLNALWPTARLQADAAGACSLGQQVFARAPGDQPVAAWVVGSNFQIQVWRALLMVGPGDLISYADLAKQAGRPGAARAVGSAMAVNPIAYLIPCHRVLRGNGDIGVYHWGSDRKLAMLGYEAAQR